MHFVRKLVSHLFAVFCTLLLIKLLDDFRCENLGGVQNQTHNDNLGINISGHGNTIIRKRMNLSNLSKKEIFSRRSAPTISGPTKGKGSYYGGKPSLKPSPAPPPSRKPAPTSPAPAQTQIIFRPPRSSSRKPQPSPRIPSSHPPATSDSVQWSPSPRLPPEYGILPAEAPWLPARPDAAAPCGRNLYCFAGGCR